MAVWALALTAVPAFAFKPSARYAVQPPALGLAFQDVTFHSARDSVTLHGWWFTGGDSMPAVVICPSENGNMGDKLVFVREWVARGFSVLTFDLRDTGPAASTDADTLKDVVFASRWVNDTEGALRYARTRAGNRGVGAWGQELGSVLAFVAAGRQRGNADAIAVEGLFRTSQEQIEWLGTSQDPDLVVRLRFMVQTPDEPISVAGRLRTPVFAVIAGKDDVTPPDITQQVVARAPGGKETWLIPDGGHTHLELTPGYFDRVAAGLKRAIARSRPALRVR